MFAQILTWITNSNFMMGVGAGTLLGGVIGSFKPALILVILVGLLVVFGLASG